jgi:hypothetical protein
MEAQPAAKMVCFFLIKEMMDKFQNKETVSVRNFRLLEKEWAAERNE